MRNCIPEETLQTWFDGELADNEAATVAAHLLECLNCAEAARTVEAENLIVSKALAIEFEPTIPTERLRERVATAVAGVQHTRISTVQLPLSQRVRELFSSFRPLAYASVVAAILLGGLVAFVSFKKEQTPTAPPEVVRRDSVKVPSSNVTPSNEKPPTHSAEGVNELEPGAVATGSLLGPEPFFTASPAKRKGRKSIAIKHPRTDGPDAFSLAWQQRQYDYAIAQLDEAIKIQPAMRPSVQVEYAYNMAVLDNAIATGRTVARRNPKDPHATQFLLDAYQSKVDLMNQVANARDRDE